MDLVESLRLFTAIAAERSFSAGAGACGVPQSSASRGIARLEHRLDVQLFERTTRVVALTEIGDALLPAALDLIALADRFEGHVAALRSRRLRLLLPEGTSSMDLAAIAVRARARGLDVVPQEASVRARRSALRTHEADAVALPVDGVEADWRIPLGLAGAGVEGSSADAVVPLDLLRPRRSDGVDEWARIVLLPEEEGTVAESALRAHAARSGLGASQVLCAETLIEALGYALSGDGVLCCTPLEARRWGLPWRRTDVALTRYVGLVCRDSDLKQRLLSSCRSELAETMGAEVGTSRGGPSEGTA